jgi:hypothetical protein
MDPRVKPEDDRSTLKPEDDRSTLKPEDDRSTLKPEIVCHSRVGGNLALFFN